MAHAHRISCRRIRVRRSSFAAGALCLLAAVAVIDPTQCGEPTAKPDTSPSKPIPKVAAIVTVYHHNSHADVIVSRLLQTTTLDGKGATIPLKLVSLYVDQQPGSKLGLDLAREHGVPVFDTVASALTLGGDVLAVDGVLLVAEHGSYSKSPTGQTVYPKRRLFGEILAVFDRSKRVVPVFNDKHLADNWDDAKWLYDSARRRGIPLMAGSSLPTLWRYPPADVRRGAHVAEIVATSYGGLDAYGFHALEMVQCLAERRAGGETGVRSVQTLVGAKIWEAGRAGAFSTELLAAAVARHRNVRLAPDEKLETSLKDPVLFVVNYRDGLRASVLHAFNRIGEWSVAWRDADSGKIESTLFWTQEARPFMHFTFLDEGVEQLVRTGKSPRPVERTLWTSGTLDALLISKKEGGCVVETPYLDIHYESQGDWKQPPPPPLGRPIGGQ